MKIKNINGSLSETYVILSSEDKKLFKSLIEVLKGIRFLFFVYLVGLFLHFLLFTILPLVGIFSFLSSFSSSTHNVVNFGSLNK